METLNILLVGLGPIGMAVARAIENKRQFRITGAVDIRPDYAGKSLGDLTGCANYDSIPVFSDIEEALLRSRPRAAVHTTRSFLTDIEDQLTTLLAAGVRIVSTSEELFFPFDRDSDFSARINQTAIDHQTAVVGTGVNPGFAMDVLPLTLTGICTQVNGLKIIRTVDASDRRESFQKKIGAGISPAEFNRRAATGAFGHIGLRESGLMIMSRLNWPVSDIQEELNPVIARRDIATDYAHVSSGSSAGIAQTMRFFSEDSLRVEMYLTMAVGAPDPKDTVTIYGSPPITSTIQGGIFGDTATVGAVINTIPRLVNAKPGLRTMTDLPIPTAVI